MSSSSSLTTTESSGVPIPDHELKTLTRTWTSKSPAKTNHNHNHPPFSSLVEDASILPHHHTTTTPSSSSSYGSYSSSASPATPRHASSLLHPHPKPTPSSPQMSRVVGLTPANYAIDSEVADIAVYHSNHSYSEGPDAFVPLDLDLTRSSSDSSLHPNSHTHRSPAKPFLLSSSSDRSLHSDSDSDSCLQLPPHIRPLRRKHPLHQDRAPTPIEVPLARGGACALALLLAAATIVFVAGMADGRGDAELGDPALEAGLLVVAGAGGERTFAARGVLMVAALLVSLARPFLVASILTIPVLSLSVLYTKIMFVHRTPYLFFRPTHSFHPGFWGKIGRGFRLVWAWVRHGRIEPRASHLFRATKSTRPFPTPVPAPEGLELCGYDLGMVTPAWTIAHVPPRHALNVDEVLCVPSSFLPTDTAPIYVTYHGSGEPHLVRNIPPVLDRLARASIPETAMISTRTLFRTLALSSTCAGLLTLVLGVFAALATTSSRSPPFGFHLVWAFQVVVGSASGPNVPQLGLGQGLVFLLVMTPLLCAVYTGLITSAGVMFRHLYLRSQLLRRQSSVLVLSLAGFVALGLGSGIALMMTSSTASVSVGDAVFLCVATGLGIDFGLYPDSTAGALTRVVCIILLALPRAVLLAVIAIPASLVTRPARARLISGCASVAAFVFLLVAGALLSTTSEPKISAGSFWHLVWVMTMSFCGVGYTSHAPVTSGGRALVLCVTGVGTVFFPFVATLLVRSLLPPSNVLIPSSPHLLIPRTAKGPDATHAPVLSPGARGAPPTRQSRVLAAGVVGSSGVRDNNQAKARGAPVRTIYLDAYSTGDDMVYSEGEGECGDDESSYSLNARI